MEPGRPLEKQKEKRQNEKLLWLFSISVLKIHATQNETTVRFF